MTVNVRIAIASHLSDAQEYLELGFRKNASSEINLAGHPVQVRQH